MKKETNFVGLLSNAIRFLHGQVTASRQSMTFVIKNEVTVQAGKSPVFQRDVARKRLAVNLVNSDKSGAFTKFVIDSIGLCVMKFAAHLTGNTHYVTCFIPSVHCYIFR